MVGGNDYVVQVKGNQKKLKTAIENLVNQSKSDDQYITTQTNRGRKEKREYYIYYDVTGGVFDKWKGLKTIIFLISSGIRSGKKYKEYHYYISSRNKTSAEILGKGIRAHWHIENKQHWVKDVILYEDKSGVKGKQVSKTMSMIRSIVMNIYKVNELRSIKYAIEEYTNKIQGCLKLIENSYIC